MWVTLGGPPEQPAVLFTYDASRGKEVPLRLLEDYQGYLQTDGYAGYKTVGQHTTITHLGFRVDEDVTALTPHRPGRAQLTHPVPHRYCLAS